MKWGNPELLYLVAAILPVAWLVFFLLRRRERRMARLVEPSQFALLAPDRNARRVRTRHLAWLGAMALLLLSLTRPQWGTRWEEVRRRGLDILVVMDTSRSMLAEDIKPNRLQQAKWGIRDLVRQLKGDRVGLVAFAGSSFLQCPLTIDYAALRMTLDDVYAGLIPRGGTAIAQALRTAMDSFEEDAGADRVIILITDGEDHEGDPFALIPELKKRQIRVFVVGVGTLEGELIPTPGENGHTAFLKDRESRVVKSVLNEDLLARLAVETGGMYVRATPGDFGLDRIYEKGLAELRRGEHEGRMVRQHEDRFPWALGGAFVLLTGECLLRERPRRRKEPAP
jgi:Ca-activated chloride channel family protein